MMVLVTGASGSGKSEYAENMAVKLAGKVCPDDANEISDCSNKSKILNGYQPKEKRELYYLATMRVYGEEGVRRVERHRKLRAGKGFQTVECPVNVDEAFAQAYDKASAMPEQECDKSAREVRMPEFLEQECDKSAGRVWMPEFLEQECDKSAGEVRMPVVLLECMSNLVANEMFPEPDSDYTKEVQVPESQTAQFQTEKSVIKENRMDEKNGQQKADNICVENIIRQIRHLKDQTRHLVIVSNQIFEDGIIYEPETMEYIRNLGQINQLLAEMADSVVEVVAGIPIFIKGEKLC